MVGTRPCECGGHPRPVTLRSWPAMVAVECPSCGRTTGFCDDPERAWEQWDAGNVVPRDNVLSEIQGDPVLFDPYREDYAGGDGR